MSRKFIYSKHDFWNDLAEVLIKVIIFGNHLNKFNLILCAATKKNYKFVSIRKVPLSYYDNNLTEQGKVLKVLKYRYEN